MNKLQLYKDKLRTTLEQAINNNKADAVMLSGGVDSSLLTYFGLNNNPNLKTITIFYRKNQKSPDKKYVESLVSSINIKQAFFVELVDEEMDLLMKEAVLTLNNFNIYWVSAAVVLLKALSFAKQKKIFNIMTGEGADDLFASFPVMLNWKYKKSELKEFINIRMKDIDIMSRKVGKHLGVNIIEPFHDKKLINFVLNTPLSLRIKKRKNNIITKYLLREVAKEFLPSNISNRPQTMAFIGVPTLEILSKKYKNYANIKKYKNKFGINFSSGLECKLFDILHKNGKYKPEKDKKDGHCLYCYSKLRAKNSVHCIVCGTLQYKGNILPF